MTQGFRNTATRNLLRSGCLAECGLSALPAGTVGNPFQSCGKRVEQKHSSVSEGKLHFVPYYRWLGFIL